MSAPRRGVVAVIRRAEGQLLVIRRSAQVVAPHAYCFPGGAVEPGESEEQALCRELWEELQAEIRPVRRVWASVTPWNVELAWWTATLVAPHLPFVPAAAEVAEAAWLELDEILALPELLASNQLFLTAVKAGEIRLDL
jgi:8-oxo-dGTP diphosphatase